MTTQAQFDALHQVLNTTNEEAWCNYPDPAGLANIVSNAILDYQARREPLTPTPYNIAKTHLQIDNPSPTLRFRLAVLIQRATEVHPT